jgi:3(or 17)beta-hydroxysteroid dehydrogenase
MGRMADKAGLITGGASGIGFATAERFLTEGARVVITDVAEDKGTSAAGRLGPAARFLPHDVTSEQSWDRVMADAIAFLGGLDVLVNAAGIMIYADIEEGSFETWQRTLAVNLDGTFLGCREAVRAMRDRGGSIINLSSTSGLIGHRETPAYDASKGGVRLLTKSVALHCAHKGYSIRCNSVHPGGTRTPMVMDHIEAQPDPAAEERKWVASLPLGRMAEPEEIASLILYLASDESSFVTGAEFPIDGGKTAQ